MILWRASIDYLKPKKFCNEPTLGKGYMETEHGNYNSTPAVIELLKGEKVNVISSIDSVDGELSTPTGIALLLKFVDSFKTQSNILLIHME